MATHFPKRPEAHQLADESVRFFRDCLPRPWICDVPASDYGVDLRVGLIDQAQVTGQSFVVQLKASAKADAGDEVSIRVAASTFYFVKNMLEVALLVKYVAADREAYWLFWKDITPPTKSQKSLTVRIPRSNRLSQNPWPQIEAHVLHVHGRKLGAMRN
jgi:hypothetical protein